MKELTKKLYFRSLNRGCKELDIIIGQFAKLYLDRMTLPELLEYQDLLELNDNYLYNYISEAIKSDSRTIEGTIMKKIVDFVKLRSSN
ncbi:MAG: succinate dehydrogenase assembly factor 2 [Candidatus Midichloria sp.]|nr:succinate dehydrogenase assembly factor 2 [Candidatus Midichloria sp.]